MPLVCDGLSHLWKLYGCVIFRCKLVEIIRLEETKVLLAAVL